jgi:hypothetical protein
MFLLRAWFATALDKMRSITILKRKQGYRIWGLRGEETGHSPSLPFSRCEAMGEGGRRPDKGSFVKSAAIFDEYSR